MSLKLKMSWPIPASAMYHIKCSTFNIYRNWQALTLRHGLAERNDDTTCESWNHVWSGTIQWHCSAALAPHIRVRNATDKWCRTSDVWRQYREDGSVKDRPRSGRPRKSSQRQDRSLLRMARWNRMLSFARLRACWMRLLRYPISSATVQHRLRRGGYRACRPVRKPVLSEQHRQVCNWNKPSWLTLRPVFSSLSTGYIFCIVMYHYNYIYFFYLFQARL